MWIDKLGLALKIPVSPLKKIKPGPIRELQRSPQ